MKKICFNLVWVLILYMLVGSYTAYSQDLKKLELTAVKKLKSIVNPYVGLRHIGKLKVDSTKIADSKSISIYFSQTLSYYPIREDNYSLLMQSIKSALGRKFRNYTIDIYTNGYNQEQLIPNLYRKTFPVDSSRIPTIRENKPVLVRKMDVTEPDKGLFGNSIALWHSHGYYFEMNLDRWEWQRARLFGTVEDISVMGYVLPYLTKMLENSGANVFLPRERDVQVHEVIVDNDRSTANSEVVLHLDNNSQKLDEGFLLADTLFPGVNPFRKGTSLRILNDSVYFVPDFPADGEYAVYTSYPVRNDNSKSARYTIYHTGGTTDFIVDQTIGGSTWVYLGTFRFRSGKSISKGSVRLCNESKGNEYIALDAVKFGGGMGNVARRPSSEIIKNQKSLSGTISEKVIPDSVNTSRFGWKQSGKPRYIEAARYFLQYAGMPDTLVYSPNTYKNDYNDDYQSRGAWVNYLTASPVVKDNKSKTAGLGLPIDISLGFHTDAGVTSNDSIIGTLAIYSTAAGSGKFPDGKSRMSSRDLSDIIQTQIVEDIRLQYNPNWTRRGLWDKSYSEARVPNVPGMLLELLSHQNQADQKFGLDPRFRFSVSRSVYKGILKYISYTENRHYVVQPLPVNSFSISPVSGKTIRLNWLPVIDTLEPTSAPDRYKIYKREGNNGFDNGIVVDKPYAEIELDSYDTIYSFKITAINAGGESFDSEILSTGIKATDMKPVLVVNGFDRISGPAWFDKATMSGVEWWNDRGVADHTDISFVGDQYDFDRKSAWLDDDSPGWGSSYGDMEGRIIQGNSFDYTYIHGKAILESGHSFYSISEENFISADFNPSPYKVVDVILGEEKSTPSLKNPSVVDFKIYTPGFMKRINELTVSGTNIILSGAYVGTDLLPAGDSTALKFASSILHFRPRTGHAVKNGKVYSTDYAKPVFNIDVSFNTGYSENIYSVEAPDAIEPEGKGAICAFRYSENNTSAGIVFKGNYKAVILGFPIETINSETQRNLLMKQILNFFEK
jgi:hypothetical protein